MALRKANLTPAVNPASLAGVVNETMARGSARQRTAPDGRQASRWLKAAALDQRPRKEPLSGANRRAGKAAFELQVKSVSRGKAVVTGSFITPKLLIVLHLHWAEHVHSGKVKLDNPDCS